MVLRVCKWCGNEFEAKFPNEKYCDEHKGEAKKDRSAKTTRTYYVKYKKSEILRTVGTSTISPHANPNFIEEQKVIQNELKRVEFTELRKQA